MVAPPDSSSAPQLRGWRLWMRRLGCAALALLVAACTAWGAGALAIDGAGTWLAIVWIAAVVALLFFVKPRRRGLAGFAIAFVALLAWWFSLEPRADRRWLPEVARAPQMSIEGDRLTVRDLRNFEWRTETDFTPHWEERRYDLARLTGVDVYLCDWGAPGIVHTIVSWEFEDAAPLAISIETRKEEGEGYSAVKGLFRQFELYYVVADERDVIGLRTSVRGEHVRLYRLNAPIPVARALLVHYAQTIERLRVQPVWYNALTANCTTIIRLHAQEAGARAPLSWKLLLNGHSDEMMYERGRLGNALPFDELRRRSDITDAARAAGGDPEFARLIRAGLPPRAPVAGAVDGPDGG